MTCRVRAVTSDAHARDAGSAVGVDALVTSPLGAASGPGADGGALQAVDSTARHTIVTSDPRDPILR